MVKRDLLPATRMLLRRMGVLFYENKSDHVIRPAWCTNEEAGLWYVSGEDPDKIKGPNWATLCINEPGVLSRDAYDVFQSRVRVPMLDCLACGHVRDEEVAEILDVDDPASRPSAGRAIDVLRPCPNCRATKAIVQPNYVRMAGTPEGFNWLYDEWVDRSATRHAGRDWSDWRCIYVDTAANVFNPESYRERLAESFDATLAEEKLGGRFVNVRKGACFYKFNRGRHLQETCVYDPKLPLHLSCDFNVAPMVWIVGQLHGKALWIIDEIVIPDNAKTDEAMTVFCNRYAAHRTGIRVHGDTSGRSRDTRSKGLETDYDVIRQVAKDRKLHDFGMAVARGKRPVRDGIARVNGALVNVEGKTRLWLSPAVVTLARDLEQLAWKPGTDDIDTRNEELGHGADALRYLVEDVMPLPSHQAGTFQVHA